MRHLGRPCAAHIDASDASGRQSRRRGGGRRSGRRPGGSPLLCVRVLGQEATEEIAFVGRERETER